MPYHRLDICEEGVFCFHCCYCNPFLLIYGDNDNDDGGDDDEHSNKDL